MNADAQQKAAVVGIVAAAGITAADKLADGEVPGARIAAGAAVASVAIATLAEFQPKLAAMFSALAFLGAAITARNLQNRAADYFG